MRLGQRLDTAIFGDNQHHVLYYLRGRCSVLDANALSLRPQLVGAEPLNPWADGEALQYRQVGHRAERSSVADSCSCQTRCNLQPRSLDDLSCVQANLCGVWWSCYGGRCGPVPPRLSLAVGRCVSSRATRADWARPADRRKGTYRRSAATRPSYSCHCELRPGYTAADPRCVLDDACLAQAPCLHGDSCTPGWADNTALQSSFWLGFELGFSFGNRSRAIQRMTTMRDDGVMAFIGPGESCVNEALVAAAWNLPLITYSKKP
ncbi:Guanylate cyclase 32E [Amphibalanus amphitrite]|uniref:Guanylate cyclase 32E n=1 Tax=Amphibalanus amphitrite TaxID=1232801 RepID=A0A6A4WI81_AMPAM|nr:Guanylate cyclase 32E [Amphibalanus amphitrite]